MLIGRRPKVQNIDNICNSDGIYPKFVIEDQVVPMINESRYLGIQIDKTLSWKDHVNIIASKISRALGMLSYAQRYVPMSTIKAMYGVKSSPHCDIAARYGDVALRQT